MVGRSRRLWLVRWPLEDGRGCRTLSAISQAGWRLRSREFLWIRLGVSDQRFLSRRAALGWGRWAGGGWWARWSSAIGRNPGARDRLGGTRTLYSRNTVWLGSFMKREIEIKFRVAD